MGASKMSHSQTSGYGIISVKMCPVKSSEKFNECGH